jgi:hypothetical protein
MKVWKTYRVHILYSAVHGKFRNRTWNSKENLSLVTKILRHWSCCYYTSDHQSTLKHLLPPPRQQPVIHCSVPTRACDRPVCIGCCLGVSYEYAGPPAGLLCTTTKIWTVGFSKLAYAHTLRHSLLHPPRQEFSTGHFLPAVLSRHGAFAPYTSPWQRFR